MEKLEFEQRIASSTLLKDQTVSLKKELLDIMNNRTVNTVNLYVSELIKRDKSFDDYLDLLKDFNYNDEVTSPVDYFSGIRTIADSADPEEIKNKADVMKNCSLEINKLTKNNSALYSNIVNSLKKAIAVISELQILETQVYDNNVDLLQDLDSIYSIGDLQASTK